MDNSSFLPANPTIRRLPKNTEGRDFVIGDLHGCFESLQELLKTVDFQKAKDRILCVGDLTDRGPESIKCLGLLKEPWFHCVLGNHDENTIHALEVHFGLRKTQKRHERDPFLFLANQGGKWLSEAASKSQLTAELQTALPLLRQLPRILVVGEGDSRFHLVHAALAQPDDNGIHLLTDQNLDDLLDHKLSLPNPTAITEARELATMTVEAKKENPMMLEHFQFSEGLSQTYCGHSSVKTPIQLFSHLHIDTGAGKPDEEKKIRMLTLVDAQSKEICQARAGHPRMKIKTKEFVRTILKEADIPIKKHGKASQEPDLV